MNVSGQQALVLTDPSLTAQVRKQPSPPNPNLQLVVNGEPRTDVMVVTTRSPATLVLVHSADHFSRGGARGRPVIDVTDYSNLRPRAGDLQARSESQPRIFAAREYGAASTADPIALYASIEGTVTGTYKGSYIDVFA